MIGLYGRAKIGVRVDSELFEEFKVKVSVLICDLCCHLYADVVVVFTALVTEGVLNELQLDDDLVLMNETIR